MTLLAAAAAIALGGAPASAQGAGDREREGGASVVVAFLPSPGARAQSELTGLAGLSVGILSASQGTYTLAQLLLDMSQGARIATSAYARDQPPPLVLATHGGEGVMLGWEAVQRRARGAPQLLAPGLLASSIPGGGAYAGIATGTPRAGPLAPGPANPTSAGAGASAYLDAALAADRRGLIAAVSLGSAASLPARAAALLARERLVVCDLPAGALGDRELRALARARPPRELLLVLQRVGAGGAGQLLWAAAAGLAGGGRRELTSASTQQKGLIASIDIAPTILAHLGLPAHPPQVRGAPLRTDGPLHAATLGSLMARLRVIGARRLKALGVLLAAWALVLLVGELAPAARRARARAWALRSGALAALWAPLVALATAALAPAATVEYALITTGCLVLGALTSALLPWPRAPLAPALTTLAALVADALAHGQLLLRSLLGPNPILGARFYGFGNELKSALAVLVLLGVAAALSPPRRPHGPDRAATARMPFAAGAIAGAGALLALIEGWARIGAAVGGVILVSAGTAVASAMLLPGRLTRRRALAVLVVPAAALLLLAALDLATAHGTGHFTGSILHARSAGDVRDVLVRRYSAAWRELRNHAMPAATAFALLASVLALRRRRQLLAPVAGEGVWCAALAGGLAAGVVGALVEDSGPVLFVVAAFALGCGLSYLWGAPPPPRAITSQAQYAPTASSTIALLGGSEGTA